MGGCAEPEFGSGSIRVQCRIFRGASTAKASAARTCAEGAGLDIAVCKNL